jgi:hypothetical protein
LIIGDGKADEAQHGSGPQPRLPVEDRGGQVEAPAEGEGEMTDDDPNEAYEVVPIEPGPHGPPHTWWTVKRKGIPVRYFPGKEKAERYATDPEYRASHRVEVK